MPTVSNLTLTMSRDSRDVVSAHVDYDLELTTFEVAANVRFHERVALVRQVEGADHWPLPVMGHAVPAPSPDEVTGDGTDRYVAMLSEGEFTAAELGVTAAGGVRRTFGRPLRHQELQLLLERGQDHPYVVISAIPIDVVGDVKLAAVRTLDLGDPDVVTTVAIGGTPAAVASSGSADVVWVVTTDPQRVVFNRDGDESTRATLQGFASDLLYAADRFWEVYPNDDVIVSRLPLDNAGFGLFGSLVRSPMALAFDGTTIWTVGLGDNAVAQFTADGQGTVVGAVPGQPQAIAAVTTPSGAKRAFIATADGQLHILDEAGDEVVPGGFATQVSEPLGVAINGDVLVVAGRPVTRFFRLDPITGTVSADATVSVPSGGAAAGAGSDLWIAFEANRLVRYEGMTETAETYELTAMPHKVLYDGDRVFVTSRTAGTLSVVRIGAR